MGHSEPGPATAASNWTLAGTSCESFDALISLVGASPRFAAAAKLIFVGRKLDFTRKSRWQDFPYKRMA